MAVSLRIVDDRDLVYYQLDVVSGKSLTPPPYRTQQYGGTYLYVKAVICHHRNNYFFRYFLLFTHTTATTHARHCPRYYEGKHRCQMCLRVNFTTVCRRRLQRMALGFRFGTLYAPITRRSILYRLATRLRHRRRTSIK